MNNLTQRPSQNSEKSPLSPGIALRDVIDDDLAVFFVQQLDPAANYMAAFTREDPADRNAFMAHWANILADDTVTLRTILFEGHVAGYVGSFHHLGKPDVTYWIGKEFWGRGIATSALSAFLAEFKMRPLYAHAARDNGASIRVLEKCGFSITGYDRSFANARGEEIEEAVLMLR